MPGPRDVHRGATRVMSAIMIIIGVAMLALTIARGGGPVSLGVILGLLFVAAGALRLRVESGR